MNSVVIIPAGSKIKVICKHDTPAPEDPVLPEEPVPEDPILPDLPEQPIPEEPVPEEPVPEQPAPILPCAPWKFTRWNH